MLPGTPLGMELATLFIFMLKSVIERGSREGVMGVGKGSTNLNPKMSV